MELSQGWCHRMQYFCHRHREVRPFRTIQPYDHLLYMEPPNIFMRCLREPAGSPPQMRVQQIRAILP